MELDKIFKGYGLGYKEKEWQETTKKIKNMKEQKENIRGAKNQEHILKKVLLQIIFNKKAMVEVVDSLQLMNSFGLEKKKALFFTAISGETSFGILESLTEKQDEKEMEKKLGFGSLWSYYLSPKMVKAIEESGIIDEIYPEYRMKKIFNDTEITNELTKRIKDRVVEVIKEINDSKGMEKLSQEINKYINDAMQSEEKLKR